MEEEEITSTSHGRYSARQHAQVRLTPLLALGLGVGGSPIELNPQLLGTRGLLRAATRNCDMPHPGVAGLANLLLLGGDGACGGRPFQHLAAVAAAAGAHGRLRGESMRMSSRCS